MGCKISFISTVISLKLEKIPLEIKTVEINYRALIRNMHHFCEEHDTAYLQNIKDLNKMKAVLLDLKGQSG